jgi:hypothetical protein
VNPVAPDLRSSAGALTCEALSLAKQMGDAADAGMLLGLHAAGGDEPACALLGLRRADAGELAYDERLASQSMSGGSSSDSLGQVVGEGVAEPALPPVRPRTSAVQESGTEQVEEARSISGPNPIPRPNAKTLALILNPNPNQEARFSPSPSPTPDPWQYAQRWAAAKAVAASLARHPGADGGHGGGALDAQGGGAAAVAIAGLAASVQQKAGLVDGSKRVASNPRKEWSATEDELIRNGVAQMGYKWRVLGAPRPLTLTLTPNPNPNPNPEPNPTPTPTLTLTLTL